MAMRTNGNQWNSMGTNGPQTKPYQGGVHHTYKGESTLVNSPLKPNIVGVTDVASVTLATS